MTASPLSPAPMAKGSTGALRSVAVVLTDTPCDGFAVDAGTVLAKQHHVALEILQPLFMPTPLIPGLALVPDASLFEMAYDVRETAKVMAEAITLRLDDEGISSVIVPIEASPSQIDRSAARVAARCDLALLAGPYDCPADTSLVHSMFAALLLESGRPVLVVPSQTMAPDWPHRAVLAWSDTPECARAIHDAIPLLHACASVDLVVVDPRATLLESAQEVGLATMHHLAAHGIEAKIHTRRAEDSTVGATLLDHVECTHADLVVAGGYGHHRLREWAFGGTTRALFMDAGVPVFFSH